jgi:hypothetical protein
MFDERERLCNAPELRLLLGQYAGAAADRDVWQDRLMHLEGLDPRGLARLHGELLAYGWVEQNTGNTPVLTRGAAPSCYRSTAAGLRALKEARGAGAAEDGGEACTAGGGGTAAAPGDGPGPRRRGRFPHRTPPPARAGW